MSPREVARPFTPEQTDALKEMLPELKDGIRRWLQARREQYLAERRAEAEARMRSYLPNEPTKNDTRPE